MANKYRATFSNGTELARSSAREYAAAYIITGLRHSADGNHGPDRVVVRSGFARTAELAVSAAKLAMPVCDWTCPAFSPAKNAEIRAKNVAWQQAHGYEVEIVATVKV